jgi:hypothetical protein
MTFLDPVAKGRRGPGAIRLGGILGTVFALAHSSVPFLLLPVHHDVNYPAPLYTPGKMMG